jgi:tetratricopeptide (TPR) repeat protein
MPKTLRQVLLGGLAVLCSFSWACSPAGRWQKLNDAGSTAAEQGNIVEAEKQFAAALREAEKLGAYDPRLATSLNNLATLYQDRGEYALAEQLYRRALAIEKKASPQDDPLLADIRSNLAAVRKAEGKPGGVARERNPAHEKWHKGIAHT